MIPSQVTACVWKWRMNSCELINSVVVCSERGNHLWNGLVNLWIPMTNVGMKWWLLSFLAVCAILGILLTLETSQVSWLGPREWKRMLSFEIVIHAVKLILLPVLLEWLFHYHKEPMANGVLMNLWNILLDIACRTSFAVIIRPWLWWGNSENVCFIC